MTDIEVAQIVETISQAWPVDRICVFGLRVRGGWHDGGDVDSLATAPRCKHPLTDAFTQIACPLERLPPFVRLEYDPAPRLTPDFERRRLEFGILDCAADQRSIPINGG